MAELTSKLADDPDLQNILSQGTIREELIQSYRRRAAGPRATGADCARLGIAEHRLSRPVTISQEDIAGQCGISRERVGQLEVQVRTQILGMYQTRRR